MKHNFADNRLFVDLKLKYVPEQENLQIPKIHRLLNSYLRPWKSLKIIKFNVYNYKKKFTLIIIERIGNPTQL